MYFLVVKASFQSANLIIRVFFKNVLKIGFCPQVNPLWEYLTVKEHIVLAAQLKGMDYASVTKK